MLVKSSRGLSITLRLTASNVNRQCITWRSFQRSAINAKPDSEAAKGKIQFVSPLDPTGVKAAILHGQSGPSAVPPRPKIFKEFSLDGRVAVVSGAYGGLGLEMALALCEAGCKAVYCVDLPKVPSAEWVACREFVKALGNDSRLEYVDADVRDQQGLWDKVERMAGKEGRMDICVAAAGVLKAHQDCLNYPAEAFRQASVQGSAPNFLVFPITYTRTGNGCQYKWCFIHGPSCRAANGEVQTTWEHHFDCVDEW
jgi:hypothetical protein